MLVFVDLPEGICRTTTILANLNLPLTQTYLHTQTTFVCAFRKTIPTGANGGGF